jgi:hypothetical protein
VSAPANTAVHDREVWITTKFWNGTVIRLGEIPRSRLTGKKSKQARNKTSWTMTTGSAARRGPGTRFLSPRAREA